MSSKMSSKSALDLQFTSILLVKYNSTQLSASQKNYPHHLQPGGVDGLQELSDEVTGKARGVFIWVKLVVNELLEHLCNGSSISELREILSAIPTELEGLYERALTRLENQLNRWGAIKFRRESYVMFQIALCMRSPMSLPYFINAPSLLT